MPRPLPWQVGHGSSYTSWRPPQAGQVSFIENAPPTEAVTKPAPSHSGQMCGRVPGLPPVPEQSGQGASEVSRRRDRDAVEGVGEADRRRRSRRRRPSADAAAGCGRAGAGLAEEVAEHVAEAAPAPPPARSRSRSLRSKPPPPPPKPAAEAAGALEGADLAHLVVLLALLGVTDDVVGLGHLLEVVVLGGVAGVGVGVVGARQLAVGLLDLVGRRVLLDAEDRRRSPWSPSRLACRRWCSRAYLPSSSGVAGAAAALLLGRPRRRCRPGSTTRTCAARTTRSPIR